MDVVGDNKNRIVAFGLVAAVVLVAGYAAFTRYDRVSGPPESPLIANPASEAPQPTLETSSVNSQSLIKEETAALAREVHALVAEERALPVAGPSLDTSAHIPVAGDSKAQTAKALRPSQGLVGQAQAKVAEAEALLAEAQLPLDQQQSQSPSQQARSERISALRRQLIEQSAASSSQGVSPVSSGSE